MHILALDLGTTTGYAVGDGKRATTGVLKLKPGRFEGGGMRFVRFRRHLDEVASAHALSEVVFEEVRHHSAVDAAHVYGGLMATLTAWCEDRKLPYEGVPVGTIKKFATGHGNAKKEAMIEAAKSWGYSPADDNEADAICLLHQRLSNIFA